VTAPAAAAVAGVLALLAGAAGGWVVATRWHGRAPRGAGPVRRILLPFTGTAISRRALDAALRLARAEHATLMPAFLATVPKQLPLDAALPRQAGVGMPMLEAIEQLATQVEVPVDARVARGRTYRHALKRLLDEEQFDRVVVPATSNPHAGLSGEDLVWLLERAPAEVVILRPGPRDRMRVSADAVVGHF
jgi:nucleotide-binding universal stress UspA family protein